MYSPCPFCGSTQSMEVCDDFMDGNVSAFIACAGCNARGPTSALAADSAEPRDLWDKRVGQSLDGEAPACSVCGMVRELEQDHDYCRVCSGAVYDPHNNAVDCGCYMVLGRGLMPCADHKMVVLVATAGGYTKHPGYRLTVEGETFDVRVANVEGRLWLELVRETPEQVYAHPRGQRLTIDYVSEYDDETEGAGAQWTMHPDDRERLAELEFPTLADAIEEHFAKHGPPPETPHIPTIS